MVDNSVIHPVRTAKIAGWTLLSTIVIGILSSIFIAKGIDINLSADVAGTAEAMLEAETRLQAKAYIGALLFALETLVVIAFFYLLRGTGPLLAGWSLLVGISGAVLALLGAVFAMNAAQIGANEAYQALASQDQRMLLSGLQATSDYTSFHLGLILTTSAKAGFFYLFLRSGLIPKIIAGWGVFASLFVVSMIVARDFIPALGHNAITAAFMVSNMIALISVGLYLGLKGVRAQ